MHAFINYARPQGLRLRQTIGRIRCHTFLRDEKPRICPRNKDRYTFVEQAKRSTIPPTTRVVQHLRLLIAYGLFTLNEFEQGVLATSNMWELIPRVD